MQEAYTYRLNILLLQAFIYLNSGTTPDACSKHANDKIVLFLLRAYSLIDRQPHVRSPSFSLVSAIRFVP